MDGNRAHQPVGYLKVLPPRIRKVVGGVWPNFYLVLGALVVLLIVGWYWPPKKLFLPVNYLQSWKYQWLASRLPAGDVQAKRWRAIAQALRQGKTEYEFVTGPLPAQ